MNTEQTKPLYIVTGATDNMGSIISRRLAEQGKPVLLASRNIVKAQQYAEELRKATKNQDVQCLQLDLSSFELVQDFVERLKALDRPVAALVNNAGTLPRQSRMSPNGFEHAIQVNFLSTALLSMLVKPLIVEGGRIIMSTSISRRLVSLPYEFPAVSHFTQLGAYAQSKLALTLFSIYLSTVFKTSHVSVNCVNPGVVKSSMLALNKWMDRIADYFIKPPVDSEAGVIPTMRALESADTGFIFEGRSKQVKMSSVLNNRDVFIKLCNDTMRILKKYLPR
ncbi:SDR family NAD(P)-dependent oxidoreductase [Sodaliphilus sp.]|uniref:SDR family NAD(P)-dependent oxidoreductase n=1 Tax=Sodaliphilus sp. TaxID=2815818 RepID=UPI00388D453F